MDTSFDEARPAAPALTGARRGALVAAYYGAMVFAAAVVVQFYLAGAGIFAATGPVGKASSLDPHRMLGNILAALALLLLVAVLIARPVARMIWTSVVLFVLTGIEGLIAGTGDSLPYLAALHVVVAAIILGAGLTLIYLGRRQLTGRP
jgi:hypothetical protein